MNKVYNFRSLSIGQKIYFYKDEEDNTNKIVLPINFSTDLIIIISNGSVSLSKEKISISQRNYKIEKESFGKFLQDAQNFTKLKNMNKLNIFKTKI